MSLRLLSLLGSVAMLVVHGVSSAQSSAAAVRAPGFSIELEGGPVWQSYNDVEIPNDGSATRFSLSDLVGNGPWAAGRVYLTWNVGERHALRLLVAPFSLTESGVPGRALDFAGSTFAAQEPVETGYRTVEGGADVDEVYSFAWLHYAVASVTWRW